MLHLAFHDSGRKEMVLLSRKMQYEFSVSGGTTTPWEKMSGVQKSTVRNQVSVIAMRQLASVRLIVKIIMSQTSGGGAHGNGNEVANP